MSRREGIRSRVIFALVGVGLVVAMVAYGLARALAPEAHGPSLAAPAQAESAVEPPPSPPSPSPPPRATIAMSPAPLAPFPVPEPPPPILPAMSAQRGRRSANGALFAGDCDDPFTTDPFGMRQLKPQCLDR